MLREMHGGAESPILASPRSSEQHKLNVFVPFTTERSARQSIAHAQWLCSGLDACIHIVRVVQVPYPLDLDRPAVSPEAFCAQMRVLECELPLRVDLWYSPDWTNGFLSAIPLHALVIVTFGRTWLFPSCEERLARALKRAGRRVSTFLEDKPLV
jgi:hypothetical protein